MTKSPSEKRRRWPYVVLAAAAAIALGVWLSWPPSEGPSVPPEQKKQQTLIAAVDAAQGSEHFEEEGARISRLTKGTALYRGDWEVRVDEKVLLVRGVALISTNPSEAQLHVTTLVTPTNEESDMIRNATKQWALAAGLSVFVLAGEVRADDGAVKAGQSWNKKTAAAPAPAKQVQQLAAPQPGEAPKDGECASCDPNNVVADNPIAQEVSIGNSPSVGPADAKVTVVLFSEAECSFCVKSHTVLKELQKIYAGKVRFVFKHFPLPAHAGARQAAIALHAAHAQGKFWEMVESAYGTPVSTEGGLYDAQARALGLDLQQYRRDVANPSTAAVIDADIAEGKRLGVKGVPAWFINGKEIVGHRPLETMREAIDAQLK